MYKIKQLPEDFIVIEKNNLEISGKGSYCYFLLKKKNLSILEALKKLSIALKIPVKFLSYAGIKDKVAITEQTCAVKNVSKEKLEKLKLENIEIKFLGYSEQPIGIGQLEGNYFEIIIRNIENLPSADKKFINYYGEQRFSSRNAEIGKALLKRDFKKAVELIEDAKIKEFLEKNSRNYIGALKLLNFKILKLFLHAYQSLLWNKTAEEYAQNHSEQRIIPIVGFGSIITDKVIETILEKEKVKPRDFIFKEFPALSSEGGERELYSFAEEFEIGNLEEDELNKGMKKTKLKFFLRKGSYATEFIRQSYQH
jgi:tRNA pseudouridine13 synthase